jgi:hypothetical protein
MRFSIGSKIGRTDAVGVQHVYSVTGFLGGIGGPVGYVLRNDRGFEVRLSRLVAEKDFDFFSDGPPEPEGTSAAHRLVAIVARGERPWLELAQRVRDEHETLLAACKAQLDAIEEDTSHALLLAADQIRSAIAATQENGPDRPTGD